MPLTIDDDPAESSCFSAAATAAAAAAAASASASAALRRNPFLAWRGVVPCRHNTRVIVSHCPRRLVAGHVAVPSHNRLERQYCMGNSPIIFKSQN